MKMVDQMLEGWAIKHGVGDQAMVELRQLLGAATTPERKHKDATTESGVQQRERLNAAKTGGILWRNNTGAFTDNYGNFVRYGLCNESQKVNKSVKSADLIGITPVTITQQMVGSLIGRFTAIECKAPGWTFNPNDERQKAQLNFITLVASMGGYGRFAS